MFRGIAAGIFIFLLSGCADLYEPSPKVTGLDIDQMISHPASLSGTIVVSPKDRRYICTQPAPDAGFSQGQSGSLSIAILASQSDGASDSEEMADVEMTGRTPGILLARELLYRLCEFGHNNALDKDEATALYKRNLAIIEKISGIEAGNTTIQIGETLATTDTVTNVGEAGTAATAEKLGTPVARPKNSNSPAGNPVPEVSQPSSTDDSLSQASDDSSITADDTGSDSDSSSDDGETESDASCTSDNPNFPDC